ncbi:DUF4188 domain-containing protein [Amycolatopsis acidicola]|uniref:DUF4188 domain-containing protein n=1 Tax=Amycolatopsis acidicola TaxID=2596893 RepID=A0A5N0V2H0_9PSEU|nr:DUF4188 domain-containing protein [Amycolatopsis acidicola]KAA9158765.1 DUF4188 domain-containing protein [Amycolatopsis acidicola]
MPERRKGRWTAEIEGDFVVFLIGTLPSPRHPVAWFRDLGGRRGMKHMLDELMADPDSGLLGYTMGFPVIVQYWRSFEQLEKYAGEPALSHAPAQKQYWRRASKNGQAAGIWHETFLVRDGEYEAVYGNMPGFGLGTVRGSQLVRAGGSARDRLRHNKKSA